MINEFDGEQEDSAFYESSGAAYQKDVVPRSRGITPKPDTGMVKPNMGKISASEIVSMFNGGGMSPAPAEQTPAAEPGQNKISSREIVEMFNGSTAEPMEEPTKPKEPGLAIGDALSKGWKGAMVTWDVLANKLEKAVTGEEKDTKDILAKSAAELAKMQSDPRIAELVRIGDKAESTPEAVRDMLWYAVKNPTMIANFLAEQVPAAALGGGAAAVATAPLKAAAVSTATRLGASAGVARAVGTGVTGASLNTGAVVAQSLGSNYVEGLNKYEGDTEAASEYAVTKTMAEVPANAIAGAFLGLAPFASKVANLGLQGTIQGAGGAAGAYQAAKAVGEEASRGEMILEFLGEFAFTPMDVLISKFGSKDKSEDENRADILDRLKDDAGRQEIWRTLNGDPKIAQVLKDVGLESPDDPNFDDAVQKVMDAVRVKEAVEKISPPSEEEVAKRTKVRQADANAAFRDTASTGIGVGMGTPVEGVIRRDSVQVDEENRQLIPVGEKPEPVMLPQEGGVSTPAVAGEDIIARQQGFNPLPGLTIGTTAITNRFVSQQQAAGTLNQLLLGNELETRLEAQRVYGGMFETPKALQKAQRQLNALRQRFGAPVIEDFGVQVEPIFPDFKDQQLAIRRGQRSRDAGGGSFYFIETRTVPNDIRQITPEPPKPIKPPKQPAAGQGRGEPAAPAVGVPGEPQAVPEPPPAPPAPPVEPAPPAAPMKPLKKTYKFGEQVGEEMTVQIGGKPAKVRVIANLPPKGFKNIYKTPGALLDIEVTGDGVPNGTALTKGVRFDGELTAENLKAFAEQFAAKDQKGGKKPKAQPAQTPQPAAPVEQDAQIEEIRQFNEDLKSATSVDWLNQIVNRSLRRSGTPGTFKARKVPYEEAVKRVKGLPQMLALARVLGKPVVFVETVPGSVDYFQGAVISGDKTIFLNIKKYRSAHLRVLGHEFLHALKNGNPEAYKALARSLANEIKPRGMENYAAWLKRHDPNMSLESIYEEVVADIVGDRFAEPEFWGMVAERNPSAFREIALALIEFIDGILSKLRGNEGGTLESEMLIKDIEAARKKVADVVAKYGAVAAQPSVIGESVSFSKPKDRKGDAVSTRLPTGVTATENPIKKLLTIGIDAIRQTPGMLEQHAEVISKYPNLTEKQATGDAESVIKAFVDHVVENLTWLHNKMPAEIRARAKLWYDGANKIAKDFSKEFDLTTAQAAGVLATQSPQKDWFQNVDLARRIGTIYRNQQNFGWTEEMSKKADEKVFLKKTEKKEAILKAIRGKSLSELNSPLLKGAWIRVYDETYNSPSHRIVTPEGDYAGTVMNNNGTETKVAWGGFSTIAKAVSIIEDGSIENISEQLGSAHKVRSFYNNIADPKSKDGHVTIDTHAVAAALLRPLGGSATEVNHALGTSKPGVESPSESAIYGVSGNYGIYADAYRIAAQKLGILPRELQSITWEAVRGLFPETFKKGASAIKIDELWYAYKTGDRSKTDVRNETFKLAEGITQPDWVGVSASPIYEGERDTADAGELSGSGLPGRDTGVDSGTRGGATAGVQAEVAEQTPPEGGVSASEPEVSFSLAGGLGNTIANANVPGTFAGAVRDKLASALMPTGDQRFNWWHKSVGTQLEKARTNPYYRKVYDLGQKFLDDVAMFAMRAQAAAPTILPNLGQFGLQFWKGGVSKADNELIGRMLAEGTLYGGPNPNTGKVWTDAELRAQYNATDKQINLYRESRAAIDQSLDDTAKAQMGQIARTVGVQQASINPMMEEQVSMIVVRDRLVKLLGSLPQTEAVRAATKNVQKVALDVNMLKKGGYAPLMRFGEFVVSVENAKGDVEYFSMHETAAEALRVRNGVMKQFTGPGYKVSNPGARLNSARFKMFAGLSPSTLEAFFNAVPLTNAAEENLRQEYLQLAVATRSALSRMIKRKGTAGYSIDATRTLAAFITSNARHASKALNSAALSKAITDIPPEQGDVANEAVKLAEYVQHPVEGVPALRGFLFFNFLGGSIAAGLVNLSQPVMMTHPYLSQWGARRASAAMTQGLKDATAHLLKKSTGDKALDAALKLAAERGITQPQEMFQLMAAAESGASTLLGHKFMRIWGLNFALTEVFNRTLTFAGSFNVGRNLSPKELADAGVKDAFEFAVKAVEDTQGKYNKGNRPNWARETGALGTIGTLAFTFKQYSIAYLEFLKQMYQNKKGGKKALGLALGMLIFAAGISGLPGADDLDDLIDTTGNWLGYPTNSKKWKVKFLRETLGLSPDVANFVLYGISYFLPVDLQARLGLANLIPGTGLLNPTKENKAKEVLDVLGPLGGFAANAAEAVEFAAKGNLRGAGLKIAPKAVKDAYMGFEMAATGEFKDERGRLVQKVDNVDALVRATGFNPQDLASQSRVERMVKADIDIVKKKKEELHDKLARSIVDKDPKLRQEVLDELRRWNSQDPEYRLKIDMDAVRNRVKNMVIERSQRFAKTAPKEMRARIMRELQEEKAARN